MPRASNDIRRYFPYLLILIVVAIISALVWHFHSPWLTQEGKKHIETLSLAFEVTAVTLGLIAFIDFWRTLKHLEYITNSLSTRHEDFPDILPRINTLLASESIHKVRVMVDVVDYGYYADHRWFESYRSRLCQIAGEPTATVELLFCDRQHFEPYLHNRFDKLSHEEFERAKKLVHGFAQDGSRDQLVKHLLSRSEFTAQGLEKEGVLLRKQNTRPPLFCWIRDDAEAVIAFPLYDIHPTFGARRRLRGEELTFVTQDAHLIQAFIKMFDEAYAAASPCP